MHAPNHPSPMLMAIDLIRVDIDAMGLQDLEAHATVVLNTIAALNEYINSPHRKSRDELANAIKQNRDLCMHMARVRDLMQSRSSAIAMMQVMQSASSPSLSAMPIMGRRARVIRPLISADNAASGPLEILGNEPQAQITEARRGGEAKEAGARPHDGEDSMQAKR